jgi:hypothetical protein
MFPLGLLATLATAFGAYQYGKNKATQKANASTSQKSSSTSTDDSSTSKNVNTYNYYTNSSESGNTLFGSEKKTKRTLFGGETV